MGIGYSTAAMRMSGLEMVCPTSHTSMHMQPCAQLHLQRNLVTLQIYCTSEV